MKVSRAIFRIQLIASLQYRAAAWAGAATQICFGLVFSMIYIAFYRSSAQPPPVPLDQIVNYVWLQQAFLVLIALWAQDSDLLEQIRSGQIAYELCRPYSLYAVWYIRLLAARVAGTGLRCVPVLCVAFLLPEPYQLQPPASIAAAILFPLSLLLALLLVACISMFVYILTFYTLSPLGSRLIVATAGDFFAGCILPIPLMPVFLQRILDYFPFRYTADLPFRLYSGSITGTQAAAQIVLQGLWILILGLFGMYALRRTMGRVVIQGG